MSSLQDGTRDAAADRPPPPGFPGEVPVDSRLLEGGGGDAAEALLGCHLLSLVGGHAVGGRIVETEAYVGRHDPASHAAGRRGRTPRNDPMFGPAGISYVYFVYGMHWCLNVVVGRPGDPQAVLIRALEPLVGVPVMERRRGRCHDLANGPARLCEALGVDGGLNRHPLDRAPLLLLTGPRAGAEGVGVSGRVGVRQAADWPLRFFLEGNPHVSPAKAVEAAGRRGAR